MNADKHSAAFDLTGQTAIVTGAATGIGEAIARRLSAYGAVVVVADLDQEAAGQLASALGGGSFGLRADVASFDDARSVAQQTLERTGRIDILVNNAGIAGAA